jgi:hypothetical protein
VGGPGGGARFDDLRVGIAAWLPDLLAQVCEVPEQAH